MLCANARMLPPFPWIMRSGIPAPIFFIIHFKAADIEEFARARIIAIRNRLCLRRSGDSSAMAASRTLINCFISVQDYPLMATQAQVCECAPLTDSL